MNIRMQIQRACAVGIVLLCGVNAPAEAQSDIKVGFVSVPFLIQNSPQAQQIDQILRSEFAERQAQLTLMDEALTEKAQRYERDSAVMAESERTVMLRELEQEERDLQRQAQIFQEDVNIRQEELLGELQNAIGRQIRDFAEAEGYDLIVSNVVYASEDADITEAVLEFLADNSE